jgi:hypothetical protein
LDDTFEAVITCSGKYWVLDLAGPGTTGGAVWQKLRVGPTPSDGASGWELIGGSTTCYPTFTPEATSV